MNWYQKVYCRTYFFQKGKRKNVTAETLHISAISLLTFLISVNIMDIFFIYCIIKRHDYLNAWFFVGVGGIVFFAHVLKLPFSKSQEYIQEYLSYMPRKKKCISAIFWLWFGFSLFFFMSIIGIEIYLKGMNGNGTYLR